MADGVDIDLYADDLEQDFAQVTTTPSPSSSRSDGRTPPIDRHIIVTTILVFERRPCVVHKDETARSLCMCVRVFCFDTRIVDEDRFSFSGFPAKTAGTGNSGGRRSWVLLRSSFPSAGVSLLSLVYYTTR